MIMQRHHINHRTSWFGFTLIEMLLVLVIISAILMTGIRYYQQKLLQDKIDKTALEMQQILTAAMTFYVAKGVWPQGTTSAEILTCLAGGTAGAAINAMCTLPLLPSATPRSPWFNGAGLQNYQVARGATAATDPKFYVYVRLPTAQYPKGLNTLYANIIANKMPLGYSSNDPAAGNAPPISNQTTNACASTPTPSPMCSAVASVMPPGSSLSNAGNVAYAGVYKHGGCIPAPVCPTDPTTGTPLRARVFVVPVSITGLYRATDSGTQNAYPITSFTAYVTPNPNTPGMPMNDPVAVPPWCNWGKAVVPDCFQPGETQAAKYWRACVDIQTQQGSASANITGQDDWGKYVYVAAFTRCELPNEPKGSRINLYEKQN